MTGETDLSKLLRGLSAKLHDEVYVFATFPAGSAPQDIQSRMRFEEDEGTTLILLQSEAKAHGIDGAFPSRMITLEIHSSLEAVGFMAHIASALASKGMGVNPVSAFYHDHLFVPADRAAEAMEVLQLIAEGKA